MATTALDRTQPKQAAGFARLSVIAAHYTRYPGEETQVRVQIDAQAGLSSLALTLELPDAFEIIDVLAPEDLTNSAPVMQQLRQSIMLTWETSQRIVAGTSWEFVVLLKVKHDKIEGERDVPAEIDCDIAVSSAGATQRTSTALTIMLMPRARYIRHLPGIYRDDMLMNQMLMMFESFWQPIESQISQIHHYLDPKITPASLLPFLASWTDFDLDDRWPETSRRMLVANMVKLNRKRGTREGLMELLETFTGVKPDIIERRADNMVVGVAARLGFGIALGTSNIPHTFLVRLRLPQLPPAEEAERRRMIVALIEKEKPAHTHFTLEITH